MREKEKERMPRKVAPLPLWRQAAAGFAVMWNLLRKSMPRMGPSTSPMRKSKLHWCRADRLSFRQWVSDLLGPVAMAAPLAVVKRRPPGVEDEGPGTRDTEAPVSARKRAPVVWSLRKTRWPRWTALTLPRELGFPTRCSCCCSCRSCRHR